MHGTLRPLSVAASGTVNGSDLALDQFKVHSLSFKWDMDDDRVKLTDVKARLYDGSVTGKAVVPIAATAAGAVDLAARQCGRAGVGEELAGHSGEPSRPRHGHGGRRRCRRSAPMASGRRAARSILRRSALRVQNIPTDNLHADVDYKAGAAEYHLKGDSLGGHFTLEGKIPLTGKEDAAGSAGNDRAAAFASRRSVSRAYGKRWA